MLAAVPKLTKKIDIGLGCIDHLLNLIVKATNKSIPEIDTAIKECRDLSGRVHHAPLDQQRIKRECWNLRNDSNSIECKFRKIISPVDTRWNSTLFMLKSIHQLRPALESLQDGRFDETEKTDTKLKNLIPSPTSFQIIEQIIPILEKALFMSEILSGDKKPTIQHVRMTYMPCSPKNDVYFLLYIKILICYLKLFLVSGNSFAGQHGSHAQSFGK
jgi:hypothetical protein